MNHNIQPIPPLAGIRQRSRWQKPVITSILAVGVILSWATFNRAQAQGPLTITGTAGNVSPAQIINNELLALYNVTFSGTAPQPTAVQLEAALTAAIQQFPAPNPVSAADNPNGGVGYPNYTPVDLTNYIIDTATNRSLIAAAVVKTAITTLQGSSTTFPAVYTNAVIEKMTGGAAAILANLMPSATSVQATAQATAIDTLISQAIAIQPSDANNILQAVINEVSTPPTIPSAPNSLSPVTLSQTLAVDTTLATVKEVAALAFSNSQVLAVATGAIQTTGTSFAGAPTVSGTLSANQNFVLALLKAEPTTIPNLASTVMTAGEQLLTNGPVTSATGAVAYAEPIVAGAPAAATASISQAISSYISGVAQQASFAQLLTTGTGASSGALGTKATAAVDGAVLGGVISNNPSMAAAYISDSGIYSRLSNGGTDSNRILFVQGALAPIASSTSAVTTLLQNTILSTGTAFTENHTFVGDFTTLLGDATKAVLSNPAAEYAVINALYPANVITTGNPPMAQGPALTLPDFASIAVKNAGTAGYAAFSAFLSNDTAANSDSAMESVANSVASINGGTYGVTDTVRAQIAIGLIKSLQNPSADAGAALAAVQPTLSSNDSDLSKAGFVSTVASQFEGSTAAFNGILNSAFAAANTAGGFNTPAAGAGDLAKLLTTTSTSTYGASVTAAAVAAQGTATPGSAALTADEAIANSVISNIILKDSYDVPAVAQAALSGFIAQDGTASDDAAAVQAILGSNLTSSLTATNLITQGTAQLIANASNSDTTLEQFAVQLTTDLGKNPDQVAGAVAGSLISGADAGALAVDVADVSGTSVSETIRAKIGGAVAYSQAAYAPEIVGALITGNGVLAPILVLSTQDQLGAAITTQAPADAGAIAQVIENLLPRADATAYADVGTIAGAITKAVPLSQASYQATDISGIVSVTLDSTFSGVEVVNSGTNLITVLSKAVSGAGAAGGDLFTADLISDVHGSYSASSGNDSAALNNFIALVAGKSSVDAVYVAKGAAEFLHSPAADLSLANGIAIATGTGAAGVPVKGYIAEGVALAVPNQAVAVSSTVAATITDGFVPSADPAVGSAQYKTELANNASRTTIAVDVAKAVPAAGLDIAYAIGLQLDNTGATTDNSYAVLSHSIASAVYLSLPKANLAEQLGAIASEVIQAAAVAQTGSFALSPAQFAQIIYQTATVKTAASYEIVGQGIATIAEEGIYSTTGTGPGSLAYFEAQVESAFGASNNSTLSAEVASAVSAYNHNNDAFDVGPVTRPETGVSNS